MNNNELIFEGAGWETAEHNGVGNCRIRTRLKNNKGRIIYLEMTGHDGTDFALYVNHCFDVKDKVSNNTKDLVKYQTRQGKYTSANILKFVNMKLECNFTELKVINDGSIRVHDTEDVLCNSKI